MIYLHFTKMFGLKVLVDKNQCVMFWTHLFHMHVVYRTIAHKEAQNENIYGIFIYKKTELLETAPFQLIEYRWHTTDRDIVAMVSRVVEKEKHVSMENIIVADII